MIKLVIFCEQIFITFASDVLFLFLRCLNRKICRLIALAEMMY